MPKILGPFDFSYLVGFPSRTRAFGLLLLSEGAGILFMIYLKIKYEHIAIWTCFTLIFVTNSYICDDAFIMFRTVDNLVHGYGPTWNVVERVQGFTEPLWMLLISGVYYPFTLIIRDLAGQINALYWLVIGISYVFSLVSIAIPTLTTWGYKIVGRRLHISQGWLLLFVLLSSKAFIDFTTSGLATPLSYLLISVFFIRFFRSIDREVTDRDLFLSYFLSSLIFVTRMDNVLLIAGPLFADTYRFYRFCRNPVRLARAVLLGSIPSIIWLIFSVTFYGFPFPNTFYAKAATGISRDILIRKGFTQILHIARTDPITVLVTTIGVVTSVLLPSKQFKVVGFGLVTYIGYWIIVGGDFMGGRVLSLPFFVSAITIFHYRLNPQSNTKNFYGRIAPPFVLSIFPALLLYNLVLPQSPIKGIFDSPVYFRPETANPDKSYYYAASNTLNFFVTRQFPFGMFHSLEGFDDCRQMRSEINTVKIGGGGLRGFCSGPENTLIDPQMLTDPLLARLPLVTAIESPEQFTVGHISKPLPVGLVLSYKQHRNLIQDPKLREYYNRLVVITQGPIFSVQRFQFIVAFNIGRDRKYSSIYLAE